MNGTRVVFHVWIVAVILLAALNAPIGYLILALFMALVVFWVGHT